MNNVNCSNLLHNRTKTINSFLISIISGLSLFSLISLDQINSAYAAGGVPVEDIKIAITVAIAAAAAQEYTQ